MLTAEQVPVSMARSMGAACVFTRLGRGGVVAVAP